MKERILRLTACLMVSVPVVSLSLFLLTACGGHSPHAVNRHTEHEESHHHENEESHSHEHEGHADGEIHFSEEQALAIGLLTERVAPASFAPSLHVGGHLKNAPGETRSIVAAADGVVSFSNIAPGTEIRRGDDIAVIHTDVLATGDPSVTARATFEAARAQYERASQLVGQQAVSQKDFEQARLEYELAKAAYEAYSCPDRNGLKVVSPVTGTINALTVRDGDFVAAGTTLAIVACSDRIELCAEAPASCFDRLPGVVSARFSMLHSSKVYSSREMGGRLISYGKSLQEGEAWLPVTFLLPNDGTLLPGAFVDVWIEEQPQENVLSVPLAALTEEQGLYFVYLRLDGECYRRQEVRPGRRNAVRVEILDGLREGDEVVIRGAVQVKLASFSGAIPEGHSHSH